MRLVLAAALATALAGCGRVPESYDARQAYVCIEESGVRLIDIDQARRDPDARLWSWKAADSPEIPRADQGLFRGYDECKPVMGGSAILVTSSWNGAVALVRREDRKCLFYARAPGAHSAEIIDGDIIAAALSSDNGTIRLYDFCPGAAALPAEAAWSMKLPWAHGVVWDRRRRVLYALGGAELVELSVARSPGVSAEVLKRVALPSSGGHDLFPWDDGRLAVTFHGQAYLFDLATDAFSPLAELAGRKAPVCVSRNPVTGEVMFTQAKLPSPLADHIGFVGVPDLPLATKQLYKARWNVANDFSYER